MNCPESAPSRVRPALCESTCAIVVCATRGCNPFTYCPIVSSSFNLRRSRSFISPAAVKAFEFEAVGNVVDRGSQPWFHLIDPPTIGSPRQSMKNPARPFLRQLFLLALISGQNKTGATQGVAPVVLRLRTISVDEAGAGRLVQRGGERAILLAAGAGKLGDLVQVILRLIAIALFELPQPVILPGLDMVRVVLERPLVPDLRELVVAELAVGIADQIGDGRGVVVTERLQLIDRSGVVVTIVDRCIRRAIAVRELCVILARARLAGFLLLALGRSRRRRVAVSIDRRDDGCADQCEGESSQREKPDRRFTHA